MVFIDTHFHASPDVMPRRLTISAAASEYKAENGLVWVKRHDGETISSSNVLFKQGIDVGGIAVLQPKDIEDLSHLEIILSQCKGNLRPIVSLPTKWVPEFVDMLSSTYFKNKIKCIFE